MRCKMSHGQSCCHTGLRISHNFHGTRQNLHDRCRSQSLGVFLTFTSHLSICRTTGTFPSIIWRRHPQRGRLCTSILHCKEGRSAPGHLLVFPRVKHHLGARDCHHSVGCSRQLPDDSLCGSQAQGHLHLQSIQCSRSADRASGSQC